MVVKYAEVAISGSPFYPEVFDPSQIRVGKFPQGILGKLFTFDGEHFYCKMACFFLNQADKDAL